jgi:hypothetical protein
MNGRDKTEEAIHEHGKGASLAMGMKSYRFRWIEQGELRINRRQSSVLFFLMTVPPVA